MDPVFFAQEILQLELHKGQIKWLRNSTSRENLLVTGNRWGKSFVSAVKIIYRAIFKIRSFEYDHIRHYRIITGSITQDQANIIFNTVVRLIRQSKILEPLLKNIVRTPFPKIEFYNGATIEARSTQNRGEYLLGNDYDLFVFDEVAFESDPEYVVEEVIKMRLADREGMLDLISTPNGKNWFYLRFREHQSGSLTGYYQSGDSRENRFISKAALDERMNNFIERRIQQNILGQFVDCGGEVLKGAYVDYALDNYSEPAAGGEVTYISGWDLARKKTATVGVTIALVDEKAYIVALERFRLFDWNVVIEKIKQRQNLYPGQLFVDATGLGDVVIEQLRDYKPTPVIFTETTKAELLTNVELFHARQKIFYPDYKFADGPGKVWSLADELRRAKWDNNNECDALMALALALWPLHKKRPIPVKPRIGHI